MGKMKPKYAGDVSDPFWGAVSRINDETQHSIAYNAGVTMQNVETICLRIIDAAIERDRKLKADGRRGSAKRA